MQKFPIDSYSNENIIYPFLGPPRMPLTPNPEPEYARMQTLAWIGPRVVEKSLTAQKKTDKKTYSKINSSPFALTSEWRVIIHQDE